MPSTSRCGGVDVATFHSPRIIAGRGDGVLARDPGGIQRHWRADAATSPPPPHAAAATRDNNNSLLRVAVVVRQRVDVDVVVRALEVQVLALHV